MKKRIYRFIFALFGVLLIITMAFVLYASIITSTAKLDTSALINPNYAIEFYDVNGDIIDERTNGRVTTKLEDIPEYTVNAFISIEDKRFYKHNGVDNKALFRAIFSNIKSMSFKEGASTISQQLIKNTQLTPEKTIKRKLTEIKLAKQLEKKFTKNEIMEIYLNTIYFGDGCYGITDASMHYFSKPVKDLTENESAYLAAIIKAPAVYSPIKNPDNAFKRKNLVLKEMYNQGYININQYEKYINERTKPVLEKNTGVRYDYMYLAQNEIDEILSSGIFYKQKLKIYTYYDKNINDIIKNYFNEDNLENDKSCIIISKDGEVLAYYSTVGEINRQLGSTIKPLLVYGPAIENDVVYSATKISDEIVDYGGYAPTNYGNIQYGNISVKESLSKSVNICAVKILNQTGINKSLQYLKKTDIEITENDNALCLALGCTEKGATLKQITSAYTTFMSDGVYQKPKCVNKITSNNGTLLYKNTPVKNKIFSSDTNYILNDMLRETVVSGTAKKLSFLDFPVYSKTGTVGNENGNFDAYNISYNKEYCMGVWYGNANNSLMSNNITGGSYPTTLSKDIWQNLYNSKELQTEFEMPNNVNYYYIDKISYDEDNMILIADDISPLRYKSNYVFKKSNILEKSYRFSLPKIQNIKSTVKNSGFYVSLCLPQYIEYRIYKEFNNRKVMVFDSFEKENKTEFYDNDLIDNTTYQYSVVPYYKDIENGKIYYGNEVFLNKIKKSSVIDSDDWWNNDFN